MSLQMRHKTAHQYILKKYGGAKFAGQLDTDIDMMKGINIMEKIIKRHFHILKVC